ncbi:MAG: hypothetical protein ACOC4M_12095 [Promethearchaeia archaeon]
MSIKKVFDAVILIRLLEEIEGIDIFYAWHNDTRYELWTTPEVISEVKTEAKEGLAELIEIRQILLIIRFSLREKAFLARLRLGLIIY